MSAQRKLIIAAALPAILTMLLIMAKAVQDMHIQRDHLLDTLPALITAQGAQPAEAELRQLIGREWEAVYSRQASVAIPALTVLSLVLIGAALISVKRITGGLSRLTSAVEVLSRHGTPLSYRIPLQGMNELTHLAQGLNQFMERTEHIVSGASDVSAELSSSAELLRGNADANTGNSRHLLDLMDNVATASEELITASQEIAQNVQNAHTEVADVNHQGQSISNDIHTLNQQFENLGSIMNQSASDVSELSTQVDGIYGILQTIQGIAEQTNLLALNAAIEAARAGEQGRGFAVVADEVRNLASKTQSSTGEIQGLIESLKKSASRSIEAMQNSTDATQSMATSFASANEHILALFTRLNEVNQLNTSIAAASEEQTQVISSINTDMQTARDIADQTQQSAISTGSKAQELDQLAERLQSMLGEFRLR